MDIFEPKCIIYCWTPYTPFTMVLEWTIKKMVFATINGGYFVGGKKVHFLMEKDIFLGGLLGQKSPSSSGLLWNFKLM